MLVYSFLLYLKHGMDQKLYISAAWIHKILVWEILWF